LIASATAALFGQAQTPPAYAADPRWIVAWESEAASAPFVPSVLARESVLAELRARPEESAESYARRAFAVALGVERSLRLGYTIQESRASLRRSIRLEASQGAGNGKRIAAKLEKAGKRNAKSAASSSKAGKKTGKGKRAR
jgi:hypothetical protein